MQTCYECLCGLYTTKFKADPFDELAIKRSSFSVIVGALAPYIKFMMKKGLDFAFWSLIRAR
nr:hypothetical protein [uncultured Campylobacter sp.]